MPDAAVVLDKLAAPPGNLNEPPDHATVRFGVPSLVRIRVNDAAPVGFVIVKVQLPPRVAVNKVPANKLIVAAVVTVPRDTEVSTTF
jgi:hypothetical protein